MALGKPLHLSEPWSYLYMGTMPLALWRFVRFHQEGTLRQGCNPKSRPESWFGLKAGTEQKWGGRYVSNGVCWDPRPL